MLGAGNRGTCKGKLLLINWLLLIKEGVFFSNRFSWRRKRTHHYYLCCDAPTECVELLVLSTADADNVNSSLITDGRWMNGWNRRSQYQRTRIVGVELFSCFGNFQTAGFSCSQFLYLCDLDVLMKQRRVHNLYHRLVIIKSVLRIYALAMKSDYFCAGRADTPQCVWLDGLLLFFKKIFGILLEHFKKSIWMVFKYFY